MLLKIGFTYREALDMSEGEAMEYIKAWTNLKNPKPTGAGKKFILKKKK